MGLLRRSVVGASEPDTAVPELTTESSPERASVKERRRSSQRYENASQMASLLGSFASDPLAGSSIKESRAYLRAMQCAGNVWSVGLSHDCSLVVSGDGAGKVSVWSASKGTLIREMACEGEVTSVSLSEDANFIASGDLGDRPEDAEEKRKGKVRIWHTHTGELQQQFVCDGGVNCVHFVGPTKARRFSFSDALSKAVVGSSSSGDSDFPPEQSFVASGDDVWSQAASGLAHASSLHETGETSAAPPPALAPTPHGTCGTICASPPAPAPDPTPHGTTAAAPGPPCR